MVCKQKETAAFIHSSAGFKLNLSHPLHRHEYAFCSFFFFCALPEDAAEAIATLGIKCSHWCERGTLK